MKDLLTENGVSVAYRDETANANAKDTTQLSDAIYRGEKLTPDEFLLFLNKGKVSAFNTSYDKLKEFADNNRFTLMIGNKSKNAEWGDPRDPENPYYKKQFTGFKDSSGKLYFRDHAQPI